MFIDESDQIFYVALTNRQMVFSVLSITVLPLLMVVLGLYLIGFLRLVITQRPWVILLTHFKLAMALVLLARLMSYVP